MKVSQTILFAVILLYTAGCSGGNQYPISLNQKPKSILIETTGYCPCGKCCGWKRNWRRKPVYSSGPHKGEPKRVGITATGTKASIGTIAADINQYPFGTIMYIPGYGWGRVEDVGSAIKGQHIDLFFPRHKKALEWGRRKKKIKVWVVKKR